MGTDNVKSDPKLVGKWCSVSTADLCDSGSCVSTIAEILFSTLPEPYFKAVTLQSPY